jgi:hypothetical protein
LSAGYLGGGSRSADATTQTAIGALEAQHLIERAVDGDAAPHIAWLLFVQLAGKYGWRSPACRAFVDEIAKRAAGA